MKPIIVAVHIRAPILRVWDVVADLSGHHRWMSDVESMTFTGQQRTGVGTSMSVATRVGPLRTTDLMEVTAWEPPSRIGVTHRGPVSGQGEFRLEAVDEGTRFTWSETLAFPWWLGSTLGASLARPLLIRTWRRNLDRLRVLLET